MNARLPRFVCAGLLGVLIGTVPLSAASLEEQFANPPLETRPWCYWYWINNHASAEGITADLEAMAEVGIGTALIGNHWFEDRPGRAIEGWEVDRVEGIPGEGDISVLSDEWLELTLHAIAEGRRLGIDIGLFNCPGWSQSGGPWVRPDQAMRYLTWSEQRVEGGGEREVVLPAPGEDFQDVAVIAFPAPWMESDHSEFFTARTDGSVRQGDALLDGDPTTSITWPREAKTWTIDLMSKKQVPMRSLTLVPHKGQVQANARLLFKNHAGEMELLREFDFDRSNSRVNVGPDPWAPVVIGFERQGAEHWRLEFDVVQARDAQVGLAEVMLSGVARVERGAEKQLAKLHQTPMPMFDSYLWPEPTEPDQDVLMVKSDQVSRLPPPDAAGRVRWDFPKTEGGEWVVLRLGMMPTGVTNHPAAPHATGFEVDKMNREPLAAHFEAFVGRVVDAVPDAHREAFKYVVADSYETGSQNWTDGFAQRFVETYGYDPLPWLPVLSGRILDSADQSDRFLWDVRRLVADLVSYEYVGGLSDLSNAHGMQVWLENYGHWGFPGEFLQYGGQSDLVSGEFWVGSNLGDIECRSASSAAHTYGHDVVYAEAFTSNRFYEWHPWDMKTRGDWAFTEGINHFVLHLYIHQPYGTDQAPGVNQWFGTEFNRHNTWFEPGKAWIDYLRRCHLLLQQGRHVADVAYFIGEDTPKMTGSRPAELPPGFSYDYINAEVILNDLTVYDGRFVLPHGTGYEVLVMPDLPTMRPQVLAKIAELVKAGGTILGNAPTRSPSRQDYPAADQQVRAMVESLWGDEKHARRVGAGLVVPGFDLKSTLAVRNVPPAVGGVPADGSLLWTQRSAADREIYFLSNQTDRVLELNPVFRDARGAPEFWQAEDGKVFKSALATRTLDGVHAPVTLAARESVFVVFPFDETEGGRTLLAADVPVERSSSGLVAHLDRPRAEILKAGSSTAILRSDVVDFAGIQLANNWSLEIIPLGGEARQVELDLLQPWSALDDSLLRYHAGEGTYRVAFEMTEDKIMPSVNWHLELGDFGVIAEVVVNGVTLPPHWMRSKSIDVTPHLVVGSNELAVKITSLWRNRVLGDMRGEAGFDREDSAAVLTIGRFSDRPDFTLAGLAGPVVLRPVQLVPVE